MNPKFGTYSTHSLHGHFKNLHFFILFLKIDKEAAFFISFGTRSQILGPRHLSVSNPVFTFLGLL